MANDATNAAILNTAANVSSSLIGNSGRRKSQERANEMNLAFWRMQNQYNSPEAQMDRLRKAGLNPNMIYGTSPTSAVGNAGNIAPAKESDVHDIESPFNNLSAFADLRRTNLQANNLAAQNDVILQESALKGAQTASEGFKAKKSEIDLKKARDLYDTSVDAAKENLRQMQARTVGYQLSNYIKDATKANQIENWIYKVRNAQMNLKGQELLNEIRNLEAERQSFGIQRGDNVIYRTLMSVPAVQEFMRQLQNLNLK